MIALALSTWVCISVIMPKSSSKAGITASHCFLVSPLRRVKVGLPSIMKVRSLVSSTMLVELVAISCSSALILLSAPSAVKGVSRDAVNLTSRGCDL